MSGKTQEMGESRDPAIKLFGKTIPLRLGGEAPPVSGEEHGGDVDKGLLNKEAAHDSKDQDHGYPNSQEKNEPTCADQDSPTKDNKAEELKEMSSLQEKTPTTKKPDKILPCPRCNSMDTKFCYFNNYNFNQPRHFCKKCQRYWTAGGTMRNVPVGAGRRKSKSSTANYHHITGPDVILQTVRSNAPVPTVHSPLKPNGTVLSFGSNAPLCESMTSELSLSEKTVKNCNPNTFHQIEEQAVPLPAIEICDEQSSSSTATALRSTDEGTGSSLQGPAMCNNQGFPRQIPYFNGSPWPYPWSPAPALCSSSFSIPFYPATGFWGCTVPGTWNVSWFSPLASCSNSGSSGSEPDSPILGKHSREGDVLKQCNSENGRSLKQSKQEGRLWVPKTLRIDDPEEAAKSSIWASMGFQNDKADASSGGGLFRDFQAKASVKNHASFSQLLHSNPAALSRSLSFQETS